MIPVRPVAAAAAQLRIFRRGVFGGAACQGSIAGGEDEEGVGGPAVFEALVALWPTIQSVR
jgi:hypothetical protein